MYTNTNTYNYRTFSENTRIIGKYQELIYYNHCYDNDTEMSVYVYVYVYIRTHTYSPHTSPRNESHLRKHCGFNGTVNTPSPATCVCVCAKQNGTRRYDGIISSRIIFQVDCSSYDCFYVHTRVRARQTTPDFLPRAHTHTEKHTQQISMCEQRSFHLSILFCFCFRFPFSPSLRTMHRLSFNF